IVFVATIGRRRIEIRRPIMSMADAVAVDRHQRPGWNALNAAIEGAAWLGEVDGHEICERKLVELARHARQRQQHAQRSSERHESVAAMKEQRPIAEAVTAEDQPPGLHIPQHKDEGPEAARDTRLAPAFEHLQNENAVGDPSEIGWRNRQRCTQLRAIVQASDRSEQASSVAVNERMRRASSPARHRTLHDHATIEPARMNAAASLRTDRPADLFFRLNIAGGAVKCNDAGECGHRFTGPTLFQTAMHGGTRPPRRYELPSYRDAQYRNNTESTELRDGRAVGSSIARVIRGRNITQYELRRVPRLAL